MASLNKLIATFLIFVVTGGYILPVAAQSETGSKSENPVKSIELGSHGNVVISIPDDILDLLISDQDMVKKSNGPVIKPGINKMTGYRIQVFSDGRSQHSLESRAKARGSAIVSRFPKYRGQIYTFSSAPNWYTRVGNFINSEDAASALAELKRAFPQFASEMRVVKSPIVIIK